MNKRNTNIENTESMQYDTVLGVVTCPNRCLNGQVKYYPNTERAFFDMRSCPFCKGKGKVTIEEAQNIEAVL